MADFKTALKETLGIEGGTSNNRLDRGGFTYKGISRNNWPHWAGWEIIDRWLNNWDAMSLADENELDELVESFYLVNFWDRVSLSQIINQKIANELFDTGVNAHPRKAVRFLQTALNLLNRNGVLYPDIKVDEILGIKTLELTNKHPYPDALLKLLNGLQLSYYIAICEKNPSQEEFLRGWLKRVL